MSSSRAHYVSGLFLIWLVKLWLLIIVSWVLRWMLSLMVLTVLIVHKVVPCSFLVDLASNRAVIVSIRS